MASPAGVSKTITLEEFLPGYRLSIGELFGWLKLRNPKPPAPDQGGSSGPGGST